MALEAAAVPGTATALGQKLKKSLHIHGTEGHGRNTLDFSP
jgi:hypothetical protein